MKVLFLDIDGVLNDHTWLPEVLCGQIHGDCVFELNRVLRPGGVLAATVPSWMPEKVCWQLSAEYHAPLAPGDTSVFSVLPHATA